MKNKWETSKNGKVIYDGNNIIACVWCNAESFKYWARKNKHYIIFWNAPTEKEAIKNVEKIIGEYYGVKREHGLNEHLLGIHIQT